MPEDKRTPNTAIWKLSKRLAIWPPLHHTWESNEFSCSNSFRFTDRQPIQEKLLWKSPIATESIGKNPFKRVWNDKKKRILTNEIDSSIQSSIGSIEFSPWSYQVKTRSVELNRAIAGAGRLWALYYKRFRKINSCYQKQVAFRKWVFFCSASK